MCTFLSAANNKICKPCRSELRDYHKCPRPRTLKVVGRKKPYLFRFIPYSKESKTSTVLLKIRRINTTDAQSPGNCFWDNFAAEYTAAINGPQVAIHSGHSDTALSQVMFDVVHILNLPKKVERYTTITPDDTHLHNLKVSILLFYLLTEYLPTLFQPVVWTKWRVTLIYESDDCTSPVGYWPLSLTSISCNILERPIQKAIFYYPQKNYLISYCLQGVTLLQPCDTNLLLFTGNLTQM